MRQVGHGCVTLKRKFENKRADPNDYHSLYTSSHLTDCKTIGVVQKTVLRGSYKKKLNLFLPCVYRIFLRWITILT